MLIFLLITVGLMGYILGRVSRGPCRSQQHHDIETWVSDCQELLNDTSYLLEESINAESVNLAHMESELRQDQYVH